MLLRTLFDAPQRRIPQSLERVLRAKPACETNENNFFLQSVAKGPIQGMPRTNRLSQTRADASIRVRARAQNDAWKAIGLFFGCLACFIAVTVGSVVGLAAAFGAFSSSSPASPPNSPNSGVGVQNVQTLFPSPAPPPFPMAPPGNVLRYLITASAAFKPVDGFVLDENAMGSLGGDVNVTVLNSDASVAANVLDAVDTSLCNGNFVLVTLQTSTFDSSYIQTFTNAVQETFGVDKFLVDESDKIATCCGAPVILGVTTTHVIAPPPSIPPQVVAEYVCFNATVRQTIKCFFPIPDDLQSCMADMFDGVHEDDTFAENYATYGTYYTVCVMATERKTKDQLATGMNALNFATALDNCIPDHCPLDRESKSNSFFRTIIKEAMPPLPSPPPAPPPPSPRPPSSPPPPPISPIRLSMGAKNRTLASIHGKYSVNGSRCITELTDIECRLYADRYTGPGSTDQSMIQINRTYLPGPACLIEEATNPAYFVYNSATTSIPCGNLGYLCVCVDTEEDDAALSQARQ